MPAKRIYDDLHGYVELTDTEARIIDTPVFQRLRRIRQLSVAYIVYPGATHTRFSHSIGTMHLMGRAAERLAREGLIPRDDIELLRIAALLHDIGHYPMSHAIEGYYKARADLDHEQLSAEIIVRDPELKDVISSSGFDPREVQSIVLGIHREPVYNMLLSSDVDVDRMDYLLRDARHTGVAYGMIDVERLVDILTVDEEGCLAVLEKGLQAVENFYVARLHMYQAVYYHKTIVAYELLLKEIYAKLAEEDDEVKELSSREGLVKAIEDGSFYVFDDSWLFMKMYEALRSRDSSSELKDLVLMLLNRRGPKAVLDRVELGGRRSHDKYYMERLEALVSLIERGGVPRDKVYTMFDEITFINEEEAVRVVRNGRSYPITFRDVPSIVKFIPERLLVMRIYVHPQYVDKAREALKLVEGSYASW